MNLDLFALVFSVLTLLYVEHRDRLAWRRWDEDMERERKLRANPSKTHLTRV
jgi:hypothetical protein